MSKDVVPFMSNIVLNYAHWTCRHITKHTVHTAQHEQLGRKLGVVNANHTVLL